MRNLIKEMGCGNCLLLLVLCSLGAFTLFAELARYATWIRWAFQ